VNELRPLPTTTRDDASADFVEPSTGQGDDRDPLALTPTRMRELGYRTIDLLVDRLSDRGARAMRRASPARLADRIDALAPGGGRAWTDLLDQLDHDVLAFMSRLAHPRYFAFIPASCTFPGALGDLIASALRHRRGQLELGRCGIGPRGHLCVRPDAFVRGPRGAITGLRARPNTEPAHRRSIPA
jgi:hypothetical protein